MSLWQTLNVTVPFSPSDYKAYEDAAEEFHPYIPFFATFDSKVLFPAAIRGLPALLSFPTETHGILVPFFMLLLPTPNSRSFSYRIEDER